MNNSWNPNPQEPHTGWGAQNPGPGGPPGPGQHGGGQPGPGQGGQFGGNQPGPGMTPPGAGGPYNPGQYGQGGPGGPQGGGNYPGGAYGGQPPGGMGPGGMGPGNPLPPGGGSGGKGKMIALIGGGLALVLVIVLVAVFTLGGGDEKGAEPPTPAPSSEPAPQPSESAEPSSDPSESASSEPEPSTSSSGGSGPADIDTSNTATGKVKESIDWEFKADNGGRLTGTMEVTEYEWTREASVGSPELNMCANVKVGVKDGGSVTLTPRAIVAVDENGSVELYNSLIDKDPEFPIKSVGPGESRSGWICYEQPSEKNLALTLVVETSAVAAVAVPAS